MLSIIIPTKNEEIYLPLLLASIRTQTQQPTEIIVADAASTDRTRAIAIEYGCRVVDGGMPGPGRNRGAETASSDFLLFLDADVQLQDPNFLKSALADMQERQLDFATCDIHPISDKRLDLFFHECYNKYARLSRPLHAHAPGFCLFARRVLHEKMGGFDETVVFCEDHDYAQRSRQVGRFGFLSSSIRIPVSTRRLDRDGRLNIAVKYMLGELHLITVGPIRHHAFKYEFGHRAEARSSVSASKSTQSKK